jgi:hypothetical protein
MSDHIKLNGRFFYISFLLKIGDNMRESKESRRIEIGRLQREARKIKYLVDEKDIEMDQPNPGCAGDCDSCRNRKCEQ